MHEPARTSRYAVSLSLFLLSIDGDGNMIARAGYLKAVSVDGSLAHGQGFAPEANCVDAILVCPLESENIF